MSESTITIKFKWMMYRPDQRMYRQNSIELIPAYLIEIKLPLKGEFIANVEKIIQAQLNANEAPEPILTIQGMKWVQDQFDAVLRDAEETKPEDFEGWSDEKPAKAINLTDEWVETDDTKDAEWDEEKEDWGE